MEIWVDQEEMGRKFNCHFRSVVFLLGMRFLFQLVRMYKDNAKKTIAITRIGPKGEKYSQSEHKVSHKKNK